MATVEPGERALRKDLALSAAIEGVSAAFASLGRVFLCIDRRFQVRGEIAPGVWTPDEGVPGEKYLAELRKRGIDVRETAV